MSTPTRWVLVSASLAAACVVVVACASGGAKGSDSVDAGDTSQHDASVTLPDAGMQMPPDAAPPKLDASVPVADAFVPPPDAPPNSIFCSSNSQCTVAGECCFTFGGPMGFCTPGTIVLGQCVPQ